MRSTERNGAPISVLGRAFTLLACFEGETTLADLARRSGLPKPTVHRLLAELERWDAVERTPGGIRLGMRLFELGQRVPRQQGLRDAAMPVLHDLFEATHETVHLAVLDGAEVVYVVKLEGRNGPATPSRIGGRMPAYCTGVGKALLAHRAPEELAAAGPFTRRTPYTAHTLGRLEQQLAAVRETGVAFEHEESALGITCAASPVFDEHGAPVAAVSITGWVNRLDTGRVASAVRTAALGISRALVAGPPALPHR